jgi:hypothetical protein
MEDLFFILLLISFFLFILGLFSPKTSLFWTKTNQTRGKSSLIYGLTTILLFVVFGEIIDKKGNELKGDSGTELITAKDTIKITDYSKSKNQTLDTDIALKFINDYTNIFSNSDSQSNIEKWISDNALVTDDFKTQYKLIIETAKREEPELGLGYDPILNAQDYPENGFIIIKSDTDGFVTVQGKEWEDFKTIIKLRLIDKKWMVDGAGIINIPKDKQLNN